MHGVLAGTDRLSASAAYLLPKILRVNASKLHYPLFPSYFKNKNVHENESKGHECKQLYFNTKESTLSNVIEYSF